VMLRASTRPYGGRPARRGLALRPALLGIGTALVYPTLIAAVADVVQPRDRAPAVGVCRFWRGPCARGQGA
jgi:hypothetical protein